MSSSNYSASLARILVHEGGYANHPKDPGGATMKGVTQRVYDAYRERQSLPKRSVQGIEKIELEAIYRRQYANQVSFDQLPLGLDYVVFDGAVHSGPKQSVKWLQRALGGLYTGKVDGVVGGLVLKAVAAVSDIDALIARVCDRRFAFMRALKTWSTFGRGWTSRVNQVGDAGQDWASGSVPSDGNLTYVAGMEAKAFVDDAKASPTKGVADAATGGGIGSAAIGQALEQLTPLAGGSATIGNIVAVLTVAGVVMTIGGLAYRAWTKRKEESRADVLDLEVAPA